MQSSDDRLHDERPAEGEQRPCTSSIQSFIALKIGAISERPVLSIVGGQRELESMSLDLDTLSKGCAEIIPFHPSERYANAGGNVGRLEENGRLDTLFRLLEPQTRRVVVTCVHALLQPITGPNELRQTSIRLELNSQRDPEELALTISKYGYQFTPEVQDRGEASLRGGILDVWPPNQEWPLRMEFFGSDLESIRRFDPTRQISIERVEKVLIPPPISRASGQSSSLLDYLREDFIVCWGDHFDLKHHADLAEADSLAGNMFSWQAVRERIAAEFDSVDLQSLEDLGRYPSIPRDLEPSDQIALPSGEVLEPELLGQRRLEHLQRMEARARDGWGVELFFYTEGADQRFRELYGGVVDFDLFTIHRAHLSHGFTSRTLRLECVAESDLCGYGRDYRPQRWRRLRRADRRRDIERIQSWTELQPGDLVVHVDNGVGRYLGLYEINAEEGSREVLAIEYDGDSKLYVPPDHAHLLSRYIGIGKHAPKLHRIGGGKWERDKRSAHRAVEDLAASMLETQAARETRKGYAFKKDDLLQREFENSFPYDETPDQRCAIIDMKSDMESRRPMDRLVCGDVGYGKTEVAMRAAFKAFASGRQVAVLVPTTVLAQQHFETFSARMEPFGVRIEMLSRFRSSAQQNKTLERMRNGNVDIVIGTHRLVQPDVRFSNLGLVVIDEEQRFGVRQKEQLKQLRSTVDVLTMTATPIPRTLYMSLAGAKDMSTIQTAPRDRVAVETIVEPFSEKLIRSAVLRELDRDGQIYMLHNRVKTIGALVRSLEELVPEARIAMAHGQMHEAELASVMHSFTAGEIDMLVCTTIIESGVDIPNVNTILIDRADRFGLADLYQLRGRVGRYNRKAYAYLLLPRGGGLFDTARQRIRAIQRYSGLGAGFNLALRDLEIRGAGNLLGREQSGHIAAIGFDLYCQMLKRTIARLKGQEPRKLVDTEMRLDFLDKTPRGHDSKASAMLPYSYIEDENLRLKFYRDLAQCAQGKEINSLRKRLRDQFGKLPPPLRNLFEVARLRLLASERGFDRVEVRDGKIMIRRGGEYIMRDNRFPRLKSEKVSARLKEIRALIEKAGSSYNFGLD